MAITNENGPKTTKLSVNASANLFFFLLHTEAAKSVIRFIYNVLQLKKRPSDSIMEFLV